jgi:hypothetical protein
MQANFVPLAIAIVTFLVIGLAVTWRNPPKNKLKLGLAIVVAGLVPMIVFSLAVPESWQKNPLFPLGGLALVLLCAPLSRRRFRGNAEAQETFRKLARRGKWKPPLWWSPLLIIGGFVWLFFAIVLFGDSSSSVIAAAVFVPSAALFVTGVGVIFYRLYLWQIRLMLDNRNDIR